MDLYLLGGFLGSGKTTAIRHACELLQKKRINVGVVTNDQGEYLVDNEYLRSEGISSTDVPNGCFCCNFEQLSDSIRYLDVISSPRIIFAESVGTCTDLVATVVKPLGKFWPSVRVVISVFVDANILPSLEQDSFLFTDNVSYIYRKQMEEADVLIINKIDTLNAKQLDEVQQIVAKNHSGKKVLYQDSRDSGNIQQWLETLKNFPAHNHRKSLVIDYDIYASGEAELAWLDVQLEIRGNKAMQAAEKLVNRIYNKTMLSRFPIGHLKFLVDDGVNRSKVSFTSGTSEDYVFIIGDPAAALASLLVNARVQATPAQLDAIVDDSIKEIGEETETKFIKHDPAAFQPGYPKPTHRIG